MRPDQEPRNLFQLGQKDMLNQIINCLKEKTDQMGLARLSWSDIYAYLEDYQRHWIEDEYKPLPLHGPKEYESEWYKEHKEELND